jgi:hypothetical protein
MSRIEDLENQDEQEVTVHSPDMGIDRDSAVSGCKEDLNFFAAVSLPEVYRFAFPPILLAIWQLLCTAVGKPNGQEKLAVGLPRGFAKTLLLKLFVIYCILFTDRRFILVVCNTATLAENFIADIVDTLSSPNILRIFGDWRLGLEKDTQELKKFTFKGRNIILAGLGSGSSLRGLNLKYVRPDVILMDDMQSKEESDSPAESSKQLLWMLGTLMKANDKTRCVFVFLGNMYPSEGCILKKLKTNPGWTSFITGAILEDGESLWPDLRSVESLLEELENDESMGHPEVFYSEVMNDEEAGSRSTVDFTKINVWDIRQEGVYPEGGWVIIDPALAKQSSDDCSIGVFLLFDGEPVLWELLTGKFNEQKKVDTCIELVMKYKLMNIVVEGVAYQESLCFWIDRRKMQLGLTALNVLTVNPGGMHKNSRIIAMTKHLTATKDRLWVHPSVRTAVVHQLVYWNPLKSKNRDDILDLLAYAYKVLAEYGYGLLNPFEMLESHSTSSFSDTLQIAF